MKIKKLSNVFVGIIIHAVIVWAALALGYNSYKEVAPLARAVKDSIKSTFPEAVLGFLCLYFLFSTRKEGRIFLSFIQYVYVIVIYALLLNLFYFAKEIDVLVPLNLSVAYLAMLLLLGPYLGKVKINAEDWLPPVLYKHINSSPSKSDGHSKNSASAPFILVFMAAMIIVAILLILDAEKAAEQLANVAYFSVVIGIGIEIYALIKNRNNLNK